MDAASRAESGGGREGRILVDAEGISAGCTAIAGVSGSPEFAGGVATRFLAMGSIETRGPARELLLPSTAAPSAALFTAAPGAALLRGWDAPGRIGAGIGFPGRVQLMVTDTEAGSPEVSLAAEVLPVPGLSLAGAAVYGESPIDTGDEWIAGTSRVSDGEILLCGLRLGLAFGIIESSLLAGFSLHPWLPEGRCLRMSILAQGDGAAGGVRISAADRNYRTPRRAVPEFHYSTAAELELLRRGTLRPRGALDAEIEHPPLDGGDRDWSGGGKLGIALESKRLEGGLVRGVELRMRDGEPAAEESIEGDLRWISRRKALSLSLCGDYSPGFALLREAGAEIGYRQGGITISVSGGFRREGEFGAPPEGPRPVYEIRGGFERGPWRCGLRLAEGAEGEPAWRIEGGREFLREGR